MGLQDNTPTNQENYNPAHHEMNKKDYLQFSVFRDNPQKTAGIDEEHLQLRKTRFQMAEPSSSMRRFPRGKEAVQMPLPNIYVY